MWPETAHGLLLIHQLHQRHGRSGWLAVDDDDAVLTQGSIILTACSQEVVP